ncbi:MAG: YcxB family protein [Kiloniellales bacterium]|nr:YcxB family protein [Kiloniellales bacterium]
MTGDRFELAFELTARERLAALEACARIANRRRDVTLHFLSHPLLTVILVPLLGYIWIAWLLRVFEALSHGGPRALTQHFGVVDGLAGIFLTWLILDQAWSQIGRFWGREKAIRAGHEGVNWGAQRFVADSDGLSVEFAARRTHYRWPAFIGLERTRRFVLLMVAPGLGVAIPRRAFATEARVEAFCAFAERCIATARDRGASGPGSPGPILGA